MNNQVSKADQSVADKLENQVLVVRGFDLFFQNTSWLELQSIAEDLDGNYSFEFTEQRATHMFIAGSRMRLHKTKELHQVLHVLGNSMAKKHGGSYYASELYLLTSDTALPEIRKQVDVVSVKPHLSE
jgi:hypothetical protein